tara:strand:+ start:851 stop:1105 length:255 start_codon:yes stop_codon:yes gene_type:complete
MADKVKQPPHYFRYKIEPVTFIMQNDIPYAEGNAIKYLCRWRFKHKTKEAQIEDLKKARQYIDLILEKETQSEIKLKLGKGGDA